ncbi:tRNA (guanosine(46)-N7)-methyltransferase TrmB [Skermania piniformis]|uniref:tRNA (guanosine(46)-N7)-methyltransferase TrmB n=1 Tax=Skermania pinensis TaxID=39122 RepID=UPI0012EEA7C3
MGVVNDIGSATATAPPRGSGRYPRVTSFRSRRAALTPLQQQVWERTWPRVGRALDDELLAAGPVDLAAWFGRPGPVVLEIGCGTGTATAAMASAEPATNLLGVEVYLPGLAQLVHRIERDRIDNLRLLRGDAVEVLQHLTAPASLTAVRVFFPDPWPKSRHHKRRLLQPATVRLIADRLVPGGTLHVATDHPEYAQFIATVGDAELALRRVDWADFADRSATRPVTKFEAKARRAGSPVSELIWQRTDG